MTDKEKFRKEVEKLKSQLLRGACSSQIAMETRCKEEAYNEVLSILDFLQEEPVKRTPADVESAMQEVEEKSRVFTEAHKEEDADTILAQMRGEELVSEDLEKIVKEIAEPTILNAYGAKELARRLRNTICGISISEDLGEYINELSKQFPEVSFAKLSRIAVRVAKWQKEKDAGEIKMVRELLADFDKHCDEYHEAGFKHGQEALMKDAVDVEVKVDAGGYPYIPQMELYDYDKDVPLAKAGDRYKVILIKEG